MKCKNCGGTNRIFSLKLIPTNRQDFHFPKYVPQIKESCFNCGQYIRFAPQTEELMKKINESIKGLIFEAGNT